MHNSAAYYKVSSSIARMDLSINSAVSTLNLWNRDARGEWLYIIKIFPTVCHRLFLLFGFEGYISNHARFTLDSLESMQIKRLETCQDGRDKISGAWNYCLLESTTMTRFCACISMCIWEVDAYNLSIAFSEESAFAKCRSSQLSNARETLACMHDTR